MRLDLCELEPRLLLAAGSWLDYWQNVRCGGVEAPSVVTDLDLGAGAVTFGQAVPPGLAPAGTGLHLVGADETPLLTQTDVKTSWPDGSVRFAVVSAVVPAAGSFRLDVGPATTGVFAPAPVTASVWLSFADLDARVALPAPTDDLWLDGPVVREWRAIVPAPGRPTFRVVFDVRSYVDGSSRVDVAVENGLNDAAAAGEWLTPNVVVNGEWVWSGPTVEHWYLTRWRKTFWSGGAPGAIDQDLAAHHASGALPRWSAVVSAQDFSPTHCYEILCRGHVWEQRMWMHGEGAERPELGPYPDWVARYAVHGGQRFRDEVLANGDLAGSWPLHLRRPSDNRPYTAADWPGLWLDIPLWRGERPAGAVWTTGPHEPETAHVPSLAYVPYLLSGDRYYLDEMLDWANFQIMAQLPPTREGQALIVADQTRGVGWGLRNLADAAAYVPDDHPHAAYYRDAVQANLAWIGNRAAAGGTLGTWFHRSAYDDGNRPGQDPGLTRSWQSLAQNEMLAWAVYRAYQQGHIDLIHPALRFSRDLTGFQARWATDPAIRDGSAPYDFPIGDQVPPGSGRVVGYTDIARCYQGPSQFAGYYGPIARWATLVGIALGVPEAQDAYDYLHPFVGVQPIMFGLPDLAIRPRHALEF